MPSVFDPDGRGASAPRLLLTGICFLAAIAVAVAAMIAVSRGALRETVVVTALMADAGDGLPPKSDVKFQGVRVGSVVEVTPTAEIGGNAVRIQLDPRYANRVPATVTARVVPSNVFAVPSVQLVYNGEAPAVTSGATIAQDRSLSAVRLQSSLDQFRHILDAVGREQSDEAVGMLATLVEATAGRGAAIEDAGARLLEIVRELGKVVSLREAPSTLDALAAALRSVQATAPELLDTLHHAFSPLLTLAQQRQQLADLLTGGLHTSGTVEAALAHNADRIIDITTHMSPPLAVLGDGASHFTQMTTSLTRTTGLFSDQVFDPQAQMMVGKAIVQFTPNRRYDRADCPRYGDLAGPSCSTAPVTAPEAAALPSGFRPDMFRPVDIGPVGSPEEQRRIAGILGGTPNAAADILFGPLARGTTVTVSPDPNGGPR
ncbi:MlaD family protein [Nocardia wallacei]|uniref:MlaD family protein n=1 Tax=Nocardia wallacei TaxID=480035 RepID=UPI0024566A8D|nr:MCE family protein [Nocardia wallacei]